MSASPLKVAALLSAAAVLSGCASLLAPNPVYRGDLGPGLEEALKPGAMHARAVAAFNAGQIGNAVDGFQKLVARTPGDIAALNGLGASYDRLGRPDLAVGYYERALAVDPASVQTLNNLGYSHLMNRRPDLAFVYLARAYASAPADLVIVNNYEAALTALERSPAGPQLASTAPVQPVTSAPLPPAGSYAFERLNARVQALVATAPDPDSRLAEHRPSANGPARRPVEIRIGSAEQIANRPPPRHRALATATVLPPVIVANGTGRAGMAARLAGHLSANAVTVAALDNAERFDRKHTMVFHGPDQASAAHRLARHLPVPVVTQHDPALTGALRLELGADLLAFDRDLIRAGDTPAHRETDGAGTET